MSYSYTKLFSSITESTVWSEPLAVRVVWVTMLAMVDRHGRVWGSVPGLARRANVTLEECQQALACFLAPDPHSRTTDHDGRRIEPIDGGWRLLNYEKYREMQDEEAQKERNAERQRRFRERQKAAGLPHGTITPSNENNADVTNVAGNNPIASAAVDATAVNQKKKKTLSGKAGLPDGFRDWYEAYPRHEAPDDALAAWNKRVKKGDLPPLAALLETIAWQRKCGCLQDRHADGRSLIPLPATYLNKGKFKDEPPAKATYTGIFSEESLDAGR